MKALKYTLKLIYFAGCPRVDEARALLRKAKVDFIEIRQEALPEKHSLRAYSSPTVLAGKKIILGSQANEIGSACSLDIPDLDEFKLRLKGV